MLKAFLVLSKNRQKDCGVILAESSEVANSMLPQWRIWYNEQAKNSIFGWPEIDENERVVLMEQPTFSASFQSVPDGSLKIVRKVAN